jgi:hypothetical protein
MLQVRQCMFVLENRFQRDFRMNNRYGRTRTKECTAAAQCSAAGLLLFLRLLIAHLSRLRNSDFWLYSIVVCGTSIHDRIIGAFAAMYFDCVVVAGRLS